MDDPSAFPSPGVALGLSQQGAYEGMSLRDYFAAKAMNGMMSEQWVQRSDCNEIANRAYWMADSMLKAREA